MAAASSPPGTVERIRKHFRLPPDLELALRNESFLSRLSENEIALAALREHLRKRHSAKAPADSPATS